MSANSPGVNENFQTGGFENLTPSFGDLGGEKNLLTNSDKQLRNIEKQSRL